MAYHSSLLSALQISLLLLLLGSVSVAQKAINLSGSEWTLQNLPLNISVPGSVPSQAHLDLYAAQVIGDPYEPTHFPPPPHLPGTSITKICYWCDDGYEFRYFGLNDFSLRWVADSNWTYLSAPISQMYAPSPFRLIPLVITIPSKKPPPHIYSSNTIPGKMRRKKKIIN